LTGCTWQIWLGGLLGGQQAWRSGTGAQKGGEGWNRTPPTRKVNLVCYADDFIITGDSKELLENEVRPLVEQFLKVRGLTLSPEKTRVTHIEEGFDFLGQHLRKTANKVGFADQGYFDKQFKRTFGCPRVMKQAATRWSMRQWAGGQGAHGQDHRPAGQGGVVQSAHR
jgi:AraC-like DNA-binding protein